jgi:hypothetical protein
MVTIHPAGKGYVEPMIEDPVEEPPHRERMLKTSRVREVQNRNDFTKFRSPIFRSGIAKVSRFSRAVFS